MENNEFGIELNLQFKGMKEPVFTSGEKKLFADYNLRSKSLKVEERPVAMWGDENSAVIDGIAFDILKNYCGEDKEKLERYLNVIMEFEINHSDSIERHENRTAEEIEILDILKKGGYFD